MFQNVGKRCEHFDPDDSFHPIATSTNGGAAARMLMTDHLLLGQYGQFRLRVVKDTKAETLIDHVHRFTVVGSHLFIDEITSDNHVLRPHVTVSHGDKNGRLVLDDGDGIRNVNTNTAEGM